MFVTFYVLGAVFLVSLLSLVGVFTLAIGKDKLEKSLIFLVSLSAGTLLGGAFFHLLPESFEMYEDSFFPALFVLLGFLLFFILEKLIHWRHCHEVACDNHPHPFSYMILVGDGVHNFIDGMIIAGSFLVSIPLGISTTLAVVFHEIPQEIGDFGSLVYGGFSKAKALVLNLASALTALLGAVLVLLLGNVPGLVNVLIPFAAGGFVYIAASDLIPELKKHESFGKSLAQTFIFVLGIAIMMSLTFLE